MTIQLILAILAAVPSLVKDIEALASAIKGPAKNSIVSSVAGNMATAGGATPDEAVAIASAASSLATTTVTAMNAAGIFKTSTPQAKTVAAPAAK